MIKRLVIAIIISLAFSIIFAYLQNNYEDTPIDIISVFKSLD